jgi:hypothetical protein
MVMIPTVVKHLETYLGEIQEGWGEDLCGHSLPFQVVRFARGPKIGTKALATLGFSKQALSSKVSGRIIRSELVMLARDGSKRLPGILQQVALELIQSHSALLRGEVLGPRGALLDGSKMEALYASNPVYFPEPFAACQTEELGTIVFIWLVPITRDEAHFVRREGWSAFESLLEARDPDLSDLFRDSIVPSTQEDSGPE